MNCANSTAVEPGVTVPLVVHTKPWSEFTVPSSTKKNEPVNSPVASISIARASGATADAHT